jgi:hypothetical protein
VAADTISRAAGAEPGFAGRLSRIGIRPLNSFFNHFSAHPASVLILTAAGLYATLAAMAALYGYSHGYPFFPLLVAAIFLGFPLVTLLVAIASRHHPGTSVAAAQYHLSAPMATRGPAHPVADAFTGPPSGAAASSDTQGAAASATDTFVRRPA